MPVNCIFRRFGINAGVSHLPSHCKILVDGCQGIPVLRENESLRCENGMPIQNVHPEIIGAEQHNETNAATGRQRHPPGFNP